MHWAGDARSLGPCSAYHLPMTNLLCGGEIYPGDIPKGTHTLNVIADKGTVTDENDRVSLTVIEVFR
jgi:hypothetical protein